MDNSKLIVMGAMVVPAIVIFFKMNLPPLVLVVIAAAGVYFFDSEFVHRRELIPRKEMPSIGPQMPFMNAQPEFEIGPDGTPIRKVTPPPMERRY